MNQTAHLFYNGRVQGVGFRYFIQALAREFGFNGWVKNLGDGRVEVMVQFGDKKEFDEFFDKAKNGPSLSEVENVELTWVEESQFNSFRIA